MGSEQFRAERLRYVEEQRGKWHYGSELAESGKAKAERLIVQAVENPGDAQRQDDQRVEAAPGQPVQAHRDVSFDRLHGLNEAVLSRPPWSDYPAGRVDAQPSVARSRSIAALASLP